MSEAPVDNTDVQAEVIPRVGVSDAERELASDAHVEFESKQYDRWEISWTFRTCKYLHIHCTCLTFVFQQFVVVSCL